MGHAIRDAANLIEARKQKKQRRFSSSKRYGGRKSTGSVAEDSKMPSRYSDDDIMYETFSEGKQRETVDLEEDSFVRHINQVLGPMPPEELRDPLRDFLDGIGNGY